MFNWLRRRRLSPDARKRLLIIAARSEEAIIETHVANLLELIEEVGDEIDLGRAVALYSEMVRLDEGRASAVTNRLLARLDRPWDTPGERGTVRRFRDVFRGDDR